MQWATVIDNKIIQIQAGDQAPEGAKVLPSNHQCVVGEDFRSYENGQLRPVSIRVAEGLFTLQKGTKLDGENIIPMTDIEKYKEGVEEIPEGMKIEGDELVPKTMEEKVSEGLLTQEEADRIVSEEVRMQRDFLLKETDWTQVEDSPVDKQLYKVYRKALRDIPEQVGFPHEVIWPDKPVQ